MSEITALRHQFEKTENIVIIDWGVSNICNFSCSYCPERTHAGTYPFMPIKDILRFSKRIVDHYVGELKKEVYFLYTGGEVTLFKDFIPLIRSQKQNGQRVSISTNGSRKPAFWEEAKKYLFQVSLSYHAEQTDLDHFIRVINLVKADVYTHVNIMVQPDRFEQCMAAAYRVLEETDDVTIDLQIVLKDFIEPYPYTDEQRERIIQASREINGRLKLKRERDSYRGLMKLVYADGSEELVKPGDLVTQKMNAWRGWNCYIGLEILVVDMNGDIYRSWCGDAEKIGNIRDREIRFPVKPHVCGREFCSGGITDTMVTKIKGVGDEQPGGDPTLFTVHTKGRI
jgi:MoaA/NifB/PqqE/SkfB family radical SAM enzyme